MITQQQAAQQACEGATSLIDKHLVEHGPGVFHVARPGAGHPRQAAWSIRADAFDVVVPSMPGYGFSDQTTQRGMQRIGRTN